MVPRGVLLSVDGGMGLHSYIAQVDLEIITMQTQVPRIIIQHTVGPVEHSRVSDDMCTMTMIRDYAYGDVYYPLCFAELYVCLDSHLMWFSEFEQLRTGVVDLYETLSDILVKALERDATKVDLEYFLDEGTGMLVISCEKPFSDFTPVNGLKILKKVYGRCPFTLFPRNTLVDLVELDMLDLDVTLSMYELHTWCVFINDRAQMVRRIWYS
uniref:Uncharacterized protein n=1 Tax=Solanum tuberosum TaxID=4113 RepID=M1BMR2_SOLTU